MSWTFFCEQTELLARGVYRLFYINLVPTVFLICSLFGAKALGTRLVSYLVQPQYSANFPLSIWRNSSRIEMGTSGIKATNFNYTASVRIAFIWL